VSTPDRAAGAPLPPDPYTGEVRLCDDSGMVSRERKEPPNLFKPELTYLEGLNNMRAVEGMAPVDEPFSCTGSAHLAHGHWRCTSPYHAKPHPVHGGYPTPGVALAAHELLHDDAYPVGPPSLPRPTMSPLAGTCLDQFTVTVNGKPIEGVTSYRTGVARDFFDEVLELADIPGELVTQFVAGTYIGSCDWGHCHRPQAGWAMCQDGCCPNPRGWVAICDPCSRGILPPLANPPHERTWHPVGRFISFDDVRAARERDGLEAEPTLGDRPFTTALHEEPTLTRREVRLGLLLGVLSVAGLVGGLHALVGWLA
jgi:hypothetical protein